MKKGWTLKNIHIMDEFLKIEIKNIWIDVNHNTIQIMDENMSKNLGKYKTKK